MKPHLFRDTIDMRKAEYQVWCLNIEPKCWKPTGNSSLEHPVIIIFIISMRGEEGSFPVGHPSSPPPYLVAYWAESILINISIMGCRYQHPLTGDQLKWPFPPHLHPQIIILVPLLPSLLVPQLMMSGPLRLMQLHIDSCSYLILMHEMRQPMAAGEKW